MKITLTDDTLELSEQDVIELRYLFSDALDDFRQARCSGNAERYVNERYPNTSNYAWLDRTKKVKQVQHRLNLAKRLHNACLQLEVKP